MKILVTNNTLAGVGGSETYAYTLIMELKRKGFHVDAVSASSLGSISKKLTENGISATSVVPSKEYDLILMSHTSSISKLVGVKGLRIQTCHGAYHLLEQPTREANKHVAVSEEVQKHLKGLGFESSVIHNGVDLDRFKPVNSIGSSVKTILSLSQSGTLNQRLKKICAQLGIKLIELNKFANPVFNVEDYINQADMVVSIGRGVYESLACGRVVLCLDQRHYIGSKPVGDGIVTEANIRDLLRFNCSGRFSRTEFDDNKIIQAIQSYKKEMGDFGREFANSELNISHQVDKYLALK